MATPSDDSKIFIPLMPSLLHISLVKVGLSLLNAFDSRTLEMVFGNMQHRNSVASHESSQESQEEACISARKCLLLIPVCLRRRVMETVRALKIEVEDWRVQHLRFPEDLEDIKFILHWSTHGTVDRNKTAQQLVLRENINIERRFEIASMYCLEKNIQTLWNEMQSSGEVGNLDTSCNIMVLFWIEQMTNGSQAHWIQGLPEFLTSRRFRTFPAFRFASFFHLLQPEDRQKCLKSIPYAAREDLRSCLYAMTKEEEQQILKINCIKILLLYLGSPFQGSFLQIVEGIWEYIDTYCYEIILRVLFKRVDYSREFDYRDILEGFWGRSPDYLREHVKKLEYFNKDIDLYLNGTGKRSC